MTDAHQALAQVREAIAAGPRPGEWRVSKYRDGRQALIYDADDFEVARVCYPNRDADAALIAACSPANMAAILAHVETQAAEIERLTAALQHEADCVEAAKEEIERLTAALHAQPGPVSMDDVEWAGKVHLAEAIRERDELRRQLAEAEPDARRYRWLRNEANTARKCDPMVCIYPLDEQDLIDGDRLDIAIDAAMGFTRPAEES